MSRLHNRGPRHGGRVESAFPTVADDNRWLGPVIQTVRGWFGGAGDRQAKWLYRSGRRQRGGRRPGAVGQPGPAAHDAGSRVEPVGRCQTGTGNGGADRVVVIVWSASRRRADLGRAVPGSFPIVGVLLGRWLPAHRRHCDDHELRSRHRRPLGCRPCRLSDRLTDSRRQTTRIHHGRMSDGQQNRAR